MKNIKLFSLIILFCLIFSIFAYANQTAITQDGKQVLLKSDGTWEYIKSQSQKSYKTFKMGTTIKIGNIQFCLNSARWSNGDDFGSPEPGYIWLLVNVTIQNISTEPIFISSALQFKLIDKEGYAQSQSWLAFNVTKGTLDGELSPNQKMRGEIAYDVEINQSSWELVFRPDLVNPGQAIYLIMKEQIK